MVNLGLMQPILAQVAFGGTWSSILGIGLAGSGIALYALRSLRPKLARDHDIFFAAVALLCGGILFFQGWRQDPILQFGQFLLTGSAVFFAVESIRLRGIATEQAKKNTPIEDYERPVSRSYSAYQEAQFEELDDFENRRTQRRQIRPARDTRASREDYDEPRPRRTSRSSDDSVGPSSGTRRRPTRTRPDRNVSDYSETRDADTGDDRPLRTRSGSTSRTGASASGSRPRRPRPVADSEPLQERDRGRDRPRDEEIPPSEYVDFRPVDDDEEDNWGDS